MDHNLSDTRESFQSLLSLHTEFINPTVINALTELSMIPGANVGEQKGTLGQIPAHCRLSDCCSYAQRNGLNHLDSFARAMDTSSLSDAVNSIFNTKHLIIVDLGSGASLTWVLLALFAGNVGITEHISVVNVDHAMNMHRISRHLEEQLRPVLENFDFSYDRRQMTRPEGIDGFASSELENDPSVFIVLNHLLHQNTSTSLLVPEFVQIALDACQRISVAIPMGKTYGISLEPWGLSSGFGQRGLNQVITELGGSALPAERVAGDKNGKSIVGFTLP